MPGGAASGLDIAMKVLHKIDDIGFCSLTSEDVVRHPLVQKIVQAYDDYEQKSGGKGRDGEAGQKGRDSSQMKKGRKNDYRH